MSARKTIVLLFNANSASLIPRGWNLPKANPTVDGESVRSQLAAPDTDLLLFNGTEFVTSSGPLQRIFNDGWDLPDPTVIPLQEFQSRRGCQITLLIATLSAGGPLSWKWTRAVVTAPV